MAPSAGTEPRTDETVDIEDVDEIIGIAAKHANASQDKLTITELVEIGEELGLEKAAVERAAKELEARRQAERVLAERKLAKRQRAFRIGLIASGALLVVSLVSAWIGHAGLASSGADVERARSQVDNVVARREEVRARLANAGDVDANDRNAELAGAENRVAVEKRRYDDAASRYNQKAGSFPSTIWVAIFGFPPRVPLSRESSSW